MPSPFVVHEVRDLAWVFQAPGLLAEEPLAERIESDRLLERWIEPHLTEIAALDRDAFPLRRFLASIPTHGRLGRYFESLLRFALVTYFRANPLVSNLQISENGITRGELDLVFKTPLLARPRHWEASVKFYLCTTEDRREAEELRYFMGTLVQDRFDRKHTKLLANQLTLPMRESARERLKPAGLENPESRALLKGMLFYPSHLDWRRHPHPPEVSPGHDRGWWTTRERMVFPRSSPTPLYMELPPARWLAPYYGPVPTGSLMTIQQLERRVSDHFDGPQTPRSVFREMMVVEIELVPPPDLLADEAAHGSELWVRESSRGHILHGDWPKIARESAEKPEIASMSNADVSNRDG